MWGWSGDNDQQQTHSHILLAAAMLVNYTYWITRNNHRAFPCVAGSTCPTLSHREQGQAFMSGSYAPARKPHWWLRPAGSVVAAYLALLVIGTALLLLPISRAGPGGASLMQAAFTATSVVCVTGLAVVDTATYWSGFGHVVILVLMEIGGLGVMTIASLVVLRVAHRLGLRQRLSAGAESGGTEPGQVKKVVANVVRVALVCQSVIAVFLAIRWWVHYDMALPKAAWYGIFHSASAFDNVGYALFSNNLMGFVSDPWICLPICLGVILGGIGLPVLLEVWAHRRLIAARLRHPFDRDRPHPLGQPQRWTIHARIMIVGSALLLAAGFAFFLVVEWTNPGTLGPLSVPSKFLAAFCLSDFPRTGGFNSVDVSQLRPESWFATDALMFIGAGPASTGGGLKITTFVVLAAITVTELRGNRTIRVYDRIIPAATQRTAVAIGSIFTMTILIATGLLLATSSYPVGPIGTEVISALSTVGLSTGITSSLDAFAQIVLMLLMFVGRLGPVTLAAALMMNTRTARYTLPEERPYIG